jgi:hypothetical protein
MTAMAPGAASEHAFKAGVFGNCNGRRNHVGLAFGVRGKATELKRTR